MKKFALLMAAAFCLPVLGLTGCGGPASENTVIETTTETEMSEGDQAEYDAAMEAEMNNQGGPGEGGGEGEGEQAE